MILIKRRLIYLIFFLVFLVVIPIIVLYAGGLRYNSRLGKWQKTGGIVATVYPKEAQVYIDGKQVVKDTPIRVNQILPREYDVEVSFSGYRTWKRLVNVVAGDTSFLGDVELFKKNFNLNFIENLPSGIEVKEVVDTNGVVYLGNTYEINRASSSSLLLQKKGVDKEIVTYLPKSDYTLFLGEDRWLEAHDKQNKILHLLHLSRLGGEINRRILLAPVDGWEWSKDRSKLAYYNKLELWVLDVETGAQELVTRRSSGIDEVLWHERGNYLFYVSDGMLRVLESVTSETVPYNAVPYDIELIDLPDVRDMERGETPGIIYLELKIGSQDGWFELDLQ